MYVTHPEQLTEHEQELGSRICSCTYEEYLWVRRKKKLPQRCPHCHRHGWNRPIIEQIIAMDNARAQEAAAKKNAGMQ